MKVRKQSILFTLLFSLVSLLTLSSASAQTVLNYGMGVVGNVDPSSPFVFYSFAGNESDLVSVRLVNLSGDYQPALSVVGTTGQQLAFSNFDVTNPGNNARLDLILPQTGTYSLQVSALGGGGGQFALVLNGVNTVNAQSLVSNPTAVPVDFSAGPVQVLRVAGTPSASQMIRIEGGEVRFSASVHSPDGTLLSTFNSNMMGAGDAVIPAGDGNYTVVVYNLDASADPVFVTLGAGSSATSGSSTSSSGSSSSSSSDSSSAPPPPSDPNVCQVSTGGPVNLRSGPGTNYTILASVPGGSSYPATGQNSGWYVIEYQGITGWIAGSVTTVTGPCASLPVIPAPSTSDSSSSSSSTGMPTMTSTMTPTTAPGMPTNTPPPMMATNTPPMDMSPTYTYTPPAEPTPTYTYTPPPPTATEVVEFPDSPTQFGFNQQPLDTSIPSNGTVSYSFNLPSPGWHLVGFRVDGLTNQAGPNSQRQFTFVVSCASPDLRWGSGGQLGPTLNTCNQAVAHTFRFDSNQLYLSIKLEGGPGVTYTIIATRID
ncbi:MAG: SH3 domain-containing protein [Phototrophicaceae bacterium]